MASETKNYLGISAHTLIEDSKDTRATLEYGILGGIGTASSYSEAFTGVDVLSRYLDKVRDSHWALMVLPNNFGLRLSIFTDAPHGHGGYFPFGIDVNFYLGYAIFIR